MFWLAFAPAISDSDFSSLHLVTYTAQPLDCSSLLPLQASLLGGFSVSANCVCTSAFRSQAAFVGPCFAPVGGLFSAISVIRTLAFTFGSLTDLAQLRMSPILDSRGPAVTVLF